MKITIAIILITLIFPQDWQPIHPVELEKHRFDSVDYEQIDRYASTLSNTHTRNRHLTHEVIGYLPYWEYDTYPSLDYDLLTQINYFSAEVNSDGSISNTHNWPNLGFIYFAQERGVAVKLCATMFGSNSLTTLLSNPTHRQNAINNLLQLVIDGNADGIDIDFELLPASQRDNLVTFMQELETSFHAVLPRAIITMATPAVDWSNAWDYETLASITDGLFIMGYNYFYGGSATAGPVSPLDGYTYDLTSTVNSYINGSNGQRDKIILGLPYYGYDWPVENSNIHSNTTGSGSSIFYNSAQSLAENIGYQFDAITTAPWIPYQSNGWRQVWYDDSLSLSLKYQFAKNENLRGIGMWALGYDVGHDELWGAIADQFFVELLGDINNDTFINILDIIATVNLIINEDYNPIVDLNNDNLVNVIDVILIVNLILGG